MNQRSDIDRLLRHWMDDGPTRMPDRIVDVVADRISVQRQRRSWRLLRRLPMNPLFKLGAAAAAVLIVAVVGWNLLPRQGPGPGGSPTASPTATPVGSTPTDSPTPTPVKTASLCAPADPECTGPLAAGMHTTSKLLTPFTFVVPEGWSKPLDEPGAVNLQTIESSYDAIIGVWPDWAIASQGTCTADPEPGVGRTVDDLVNFLVDHPGLVTSDPQPVSVGGLDGTLLDIRADAAWRGPCFPRVNLFTHRSTIDDVGWWDIDDSDRLRLYFLDAGDGRVVNVDIQTSEAEDYETFLDLATPVVESFDFTP